MLHPFKSPDGPHTPLGSYSIVCSYYISLDGFFISREIYLMNAPTKAETVRLTTKGQIVIPLRLRKEFQIEAGTRAVVEATAKGILLKPVTAATIRRARGILKRKPGQKSLADEWAEHKQHEHEAELVTGDPEFKAMEKEIRIKWLK